MCGFIFSEELGEGGGGEGGGGGGDMSFSLFDFCCFCQQIVGLVIIIRPPHIAYSGQNNCLDTSRIPVKIIVGLVIIIRPPHIAYRVKTIA